MKVFFQINWYARRIGIAGIYKATELYFVQDSSADYEATWKFLERRIEDASVVHNVMMQTDDLLKNLQNATSSGFATVSSLSLG